MKIRVKFFSGILFLLAWALPSSGSVVINEILYHPTSTNVLEEWIELYNTGQTNVDLSGWRLTKGLQFTFPTNTIIAAGGYLVIAADAATFAAKHPGVANVVAGSAGALDGHTIELNDKAGQTVNSVSYFSDGDWAMRRMGPLVYDHQGWEWYAAHDGLGASLELINPALPNSYAHNWGASATLNGTPGGPNSIAAANTAPFISGVAHAPAIPQPTDVVTVSARLVDEHTNGLTATLNYRVDGAASFTALPMFDDGIHGDGLAGDGIFAATLPSQPNSTVVEFFLQARDLENHLRTYPEFIPPTNSLRTANLLYQVDGSAYNGSQPVYRIIMTELERAELYALGRKCPDSDSDAAMNASFITTDGVVTGGSTTQLRYNVSVRNRGHGTRQSNPNNYHLDIASDRKWKDQTGINLNSQYAHVQMVGSAVFRRLGVPMADSRAVQVRVNSTNLMATVVGNSFGSYAANEQYNDDLVHRQFPLDAQGNSYRGIRQAALCDPLFQNSVADLKWNGASYAIAAYTNAYFKENHQLENDWSDLISLIGVLNVTNGTTAASYVNDVRRVLNVDQWMKYMAINTLLDNNETCLANGYGDDYALYRGTNDTRFVVLPYDLDTVMGRGLNSVSPRDGLFRMTALPVMDRFMKTPEFAPIYYRWLKALAETSFSPSKINPLLDQLLAGYAPLATVDAMKAFNASHVNYVLSQIPLTLTVASGLPVTNGYPRSTVATTTLSGSANAIETSSILIDGSSATYVAWQGTWTNNVTLTPGLNRILVQSLGSNGVEFARTNIDIWYDDGSMTTVGGTIAASTTWTAAGGPYNVTTSLTVASGATLTIQPGTTIYLGSGVNFTVANGGRLLAEGTATAPVRFTRAPGATGNWGNLTVNGAVGSPETRIAHAHFEFNANSTGTPCIEVSAGTVYFDHLTFGNTAAPYIHVDGASFVIRDCVFPDPASGFEPVHGTGGVKSGGRGIFLRNFFGATTGYNDVVDFTGGNRPSPIVQFINNVFSGSSDDELDLDGTDAWVEGNIFLHAHKNGSPDSSSAVSGGSDSGNTSQVTVIGNLFYDCDQAATAKQGNFFTFINNTIVHQTRQGGLDTDSGVVNVQDLDPGPPTTFGAGFYLEANIILDAEKLVRNYDPAQTTVTFNNNILPFAWSGPGNGNTLADPLLNYMPQLAETHFTSWEQAQVLRDWFALQPGSPGRGNGPNGRDQGGVVPIGASISGEPPGTNNQTTATLSVGVARTGNGIPASGWPSGSGYTHYLWRLDSGAWSAETPISTPIILTSLANGAHHVEVSGKRDSGLYQDNPDFGSDATITMSRTWTVNTSYVPPTTPRIRINEVLAVNSTTLTNAGVTPDLIELYNYGATAVDLSGLGLTDNSGTPDKFSFAPGTQLGAGQVLVLYADNNTAAPGIHLGFSLKANGDDIYLYDKPASGGALLDSVVFGVQLPDYSIGRATDGSWMLCKPTFGAANVALALGDPHGVRINEWLADAQFLAAHDFIELFNPSPAPVALGGCYFSDAAGAPALSPIPALSFIAGGGYLSFVADGDPGQGADHVNFKLDPDVGIILLSDGELSLIDAVNYGPQQTDVAQGRSPSGSDTLVNFLQPTSGGPNPAPNGGTTTVTNVTSVVVNLLAITNTWKYNNTGTDLGTAWSQVSFNDSGWTNSGRGLFGTENSGVYPYPILTSIPAPNQTGGHITVYYRTHFQWTGGLTNFILVSTNYVDDGAVYYLNGAKVGSLRMPATVNYSTFATIQPTEGQTEILTFTTNNLVNGDNLMAVEVHQSGTNSTDDVFGMQLSAVQSTTNLITTTTVGVPVVLNEILASNQSLTNADGSTSDWIELFNTSTNALDLADVSLSNDPNAPRKFVFAPGTVVPAGGFLLVYCNNNVPVSPNNTGFALNADGGTVFLFNRSINGGGLIDAISFGLQTADYSLGRIPNGSGGWTLNVATPGALNSAAGLGTVANLSINEWMADPASGDDWFELYNSGGQPVSLGGLFFTDDLTKKTVSPVQPLSFIGTGAHGFLRFVADSNPDAGANHVKFKLGRSGDEIGLYSPSGTLVAGVSFGQQQTGVSQGRFPDGSPYVISFANSVSPGESNYLPLGNVVVNEVLSHTDPPYEDAIEFYNPSASAVDIGGWYLSNTQDDLKKYRIANGTTIPPGGFKVFYEFQFNPTNGSSVPFTFNSAHGDQAYLSQADGSGNLTGYRATSKFGAAANRISFGRYTNSIGQADLVAMNAMSFGVNNPATVGQFRAGSGAANPAPLVGPIVINEIMFHPPAVDVLEDNTQDEYIELLNITANTVPLFDPAATTNTWKLAGGVEYTFPQNVSLQRGGLLLLVNFDPVLDSAASAEFRARYNLGAGVPLFGPYSGKLSNTGESVSLYKPDPPQAPPHPDAGFVPYVLVEHIDFQNIAPWPVGADSTGFSLQRQVAGSYGNDPANWFTAAPTAQAVNTATAVDADADGLPDAWEQQFFPSISDPRATPDADPDSDGYDNLQEYVAGTNPMDGSSKLKIDAIAVAGSEPALQFSAVAGKTYTVLYRDDLSNGAWSTLQNVPAQASDGVVTIPDPTIGSGTTRFYRLVTPQLP